MALIARASPHRGITVTPGSPSSWLPLSILAGRDDCVSDGINNTCEKPSSQSPVTWIVLISVIGVGLLVVTFVLLYLHIRRGRRDKREDAMDKFEMGDYGLPPKPPKKGGERAPAIHVPAAGRSGSIQSTARQQNNPFGSSAELAYEKRHQENPFGASAERAYEKQLPDFPPR